MRKNSVPAKKQIENKIIHVRGIPVMIDSDLAEIYQTETKFINRAMKRNPERFPKTFAFQLTASEWKTLKENHSEKNKSNLRFQNGTSRFHGGRRTLPYVFTEQGVAMLSAVLQTETAIKVSINIINAFVEMRKIIDGHPGLLKRIEGIELKQAEADHHFEKVFKALENKNVIPNQGIFFDGQVFDAYEIASKIIRNAKKSIVLIDNFIDEQTITILTKKNKNVAVLLLSKNSSKQLQLDIQKANEQYGHFKFELFTKSHDRFLIVDNEHIYHLGSSLKDLGKKWFAFSKMDKFSVNHIINAIKNLI